MLDSFLNLVRNRPLRRSLQIGFAFCSLSAFAQWDSNDSITLRSIEDNVSFIEGYVSDALDDFDDYKSKMLTLPDLVNLFISDENDQVYTFKQGITDLSTNLSTSVNLSITNALDQGFQDLAMHIDNLSNYLHQTQCYHPDLTTNLLFILSYYISGMSVSQANNYPSNDDLKNYFKALFGRQPSSAELSIIRNLAKNHGIGKYFLLQKYADIDDRFLDPAFSAQSFLTRRSYYFQNPDVQTINSFARHKYYQYGTRPLIDLMASFTNDFPISGPSVVTVTDPENGEVSSFSQSFADSAVSLSDSATALIPSIEDDVTPANTNDIEQVRDGTYAAELNKLTSSSPDNQTQENDILNTINDPTFSSDFVSALDSAGKYNGFLLDLGSFGARGIAQVTILSPDMSGKTARYFNFFMSVCDAIVTLYFGSMLWGLVLQQSSHWAVL